ncbi:MAG: hypothetical protein JO197_01285 [Acidobacteria bacterium]|nr:hypothetical protein [Acidobacteriota bacterium]MBV9476252.1 hypothetical protein [Acidobacteriota bacterium]
MRILLAATVSLLLASSAFAVDVEHRFQSTVPRGQVQRVLIDVPFGTFTVRNGTADRLALSGIASRDYDGQHERDWAQKVVDDTSIEFVVNGAQATLRRKFGPQADSWRARKFTGIDVRIELPPGVDVEFATSAGEIDVDGNFGDLEIGLRAGEIRVNVPRDSVHELNASSRIGEVHANLGTQLVDREGILPGRTHFVNPTGGRSHVNVHTTVGEVNVTLSR